MQIVLIENSDLVISEWSLGENRTMYPREATEEQNKSSNLGTEGNWPISVIKKMILVERVQKRDLKILFR